MSEFLPVFVSNALGENRELVPLVSSGRASPERVLSFCRSYRIAAIGALFLGSAPDEFRLLLSKSARAFAHWLAQTGSAPPVLSRTLPLFDAIVAGDDEAARQIAARVRRDWAKGEEYEEDFLFVEYLLGRFIRDAPEADRKAWLDRWDVVLAGDEDPRLGACRALEAGDADAFGTAMDLLATERADHYRNLADKGLLEPEQGATERHLSVEILALLRLGDGLGLGTEPDYPGAPSLGRDRAPLVFPPDAWRRPGD